MWTSRGCLLPIRWEWSRSGWMFISSSSSDHCPFWWVEITWPESMVTWALPSNSPQEPHRDPLSLPYFSPCTWTTAETRTVDASNTSITQVLPMAQNLNCLGLRASNSPGHNVPSKCPVFNPGFHPGLVFTNYRETYVSDWFLSFMPRQAVKSDPTVSHNIVYGRYEWDFYFQNQGNQKWIFYLFSLKPWSLD